MDHSREYTLTFPENNTKRSNHAGEITDTVTDTGAKGTSPAVYTGKPAKAVVGTTNIYLYRVDGRTEASRVSVTCVGGLSERVRETSEVGIIDEVSVASDSHGTSKEITVAATEKT